METAVECLLEVFSHFGDQLLGFCGIWVRFLCDLFGIGLGFHWGWPMFGFVLDVSGNLVRFLGFI